MRPVPRILLLIVAFVGPIAIARAAEQCAYTEYRLPQHIRPSHYDVTFNMDPTHPSYEGSVKIHLSVDDDPSEAPKNVIVLHAAPNLGLGEIHYHQLGTDEDEQLDLVDSICRNDANQHLVITLKESLSKGSRGQLVLTFKADLQTDYTGIFRTMPTEKGPYRYSSSYVSTIFGVLNARKGLPCFDEPSFKATFDLTIVHDAKKQALSNAPVESVESDESGTLTTTKFETTTPLSTYLFGIAIGEFDHEEQLVGRKNTPVRIYFRPSNKNKQRYALDTAVRAIVFLEEYFDIAFPLPKLDLVTLPGWSKEKDAMENFGLIVFDENDILGEWETMTPEKKVFATKLIAHQLAHHYFGDMVTMKWWNDVWMIEGYALWMQEKITSHLYPDIGVERTTLIDTHAEALDVDTVLETHPIALENVRKNIRAFFDHISFTKSTALYSYLHDTYVGYEKFREGMRNLLKKRMYGLVDSSDFINELTAASGKPVDKFMESWLAEAGHPLVRASLDSQGRKLILQQGRHRPCADKLKCAWPKEAEQTWMIPMTMLVSDGKGKQAKLERIFDQKTMEVELPEWFNSKNKDHWLVLNEDSRGLYRVLYDDKLLKRLARPISTQQLGLLARADLVDDLRSHYENGLINSGELRNSLSLFIGDRDEVVTKNLAIAFRNLLSNTKSFLARPRLQRLGRKLFVPVLEERGLVRRGMSLIEGFGLNDTYSALLDIKCERFIERSLDAFNTNLQGRGNFVVTPVMLDVVAKYGTKEMKEAQTQLKIFSKKEKWDFRRVVTEVPV